MTTNEIRSAIIVGIADLRKREYGWDNREALPVRPDAYDYALTLLQPSGLKIPMSCGIPHVEIYADGVIVLRFKRDGRILDIEIPCAGIIVYRRIWPGGETKVDGIARSKHAWREEIADVDAALAWLQGEPDPVNNHEETHRI